MIRRDSGHPGSAAYAGPMMRDLIAAFSTAARDRMKEAGWRKRSGDIFTLDLGEGYFAWLGLNRATKHHPLQVNPVVGLRYDPLERLLAELDGRKPHTTATLAKPIGYLTPENTFLQLHVAHTDDAGPAADQLRDLVDKYGLPFARRFAGQDELEAALREATYVPNPERTRQLLPAFLFLRANYAEARACLKDGLAAYAANPEWLVSQAYREFTSALTARLDHAN
jgi:hypothetical protein